jgi:hypothetical protein
MPAADITDYHARVRDAVQAALAAALPGLPWHAVDDVDDAARLTLPCGVVCPVGPEQDRADFSTNERDGIAYSCAVLLLGTGTTRGEKATGPATLTGFRRAVRTTFHNKRLTGVSEVAVCEVADAGPLVDEKQPLFQRLATALVVTCAGRFPRT